MKMTKTLLGFAIGGLLASSQALALEVHESNLFFGEGDRIQVIDRNGENKAYTEDDKRVHPKLTEHSRKMDQSVIKVDDNTYMIYGYGITAPVVFEGKDGLIVVDPGETTEHGAETHEVFRAATGITKPVVGIVYTHNHIDHISGVRGWVSQEDVDSGKAKIYAHDTLVGAVANWSSNVGNILGHRTSYTAASFSGIGPHGSINSALGSQFDVGHIGFMLPTDTFADVLDISIPGLNIELHYIPSETNDEIVAWLPDQKILHAAEVLQGENFPNLHTIRGTKARDAEVWFNGIDQMRQFPAEIMVNAHGRPVEGADNVANVLTAYRDAIQYTHDQSVRYINHGYRPFEMIEAVKLPKHLAEHPWLGEHYGTVAHAVQQQYSNYIGFYHADPWQLEPMQYDRRAEETVKMMGGRDAVMKAAAQYIKDGDFTFAAEILTPVITMNVDDIEARNLKADAYRNWGYDQLNVNWRNWAMTAVGELLDNLDFETGADFTSDEVLRELPSKNIMDMMTVRLKAEDVVDAHFSTAIRFTDTNEDFTFEIRRGIAQLHQEVLSDSTTVVETTRALLNDMLAAKDGANAVLGQAIQTGEFKFTKGDMESFQVFMASFEKPTPREELKLIAR
ncbi:MBL fold metallo-hydrolase [Vibrio kyushuensis]|uniref:alkyl sulfatase dimerization domain-containing protein n=1 Tax=Vibrio kyushuensis TaxID=2910249 RepID=UPI003D0FE10C